MIGILELLVRWLQEIGQFFIKSPVGNTKYGANWVRTRHREHREISRKAGRKIGSPCQMLIDLCKIV